MKIAMVNQKGGTGKTTLAFHLSYLLAEKFKTLAVDLDPQAALTRASGLDPESLDVAIDAVFQSYVKGNRNVSAAEVARNVAFGGIDYQILPSRLSLDTANVFLVNLIGREKVLRKALKDVDADVVLMDCQPTFSLLTINALVAADAVLIPVEPAYFSLYGLLSLLDLISMIKEDQNPDLEVLGIVPNKIPVRSSIANELMMKLKKLQDYRVLTPIPTTSYFERALRERKRIDEYPASTAKRASNALLEIRDIIAEKIKGV
ncbi:MAG: ParA family protein [Archaeoglobaceae archaeon]